MKKICIVLALLIATPAFAALSVYCEDEGSGVVAIKYSGADDGNRPAALALKITADSGAALTLNSGFKTGESTSGSPGYGIFPGSIYIDANGDPCDWGNPLADPCDPGPGTGDGTGYVVIEMGALYNGASNKPLEADTLCTFTASASCTVTVQDEDTYRGGVVLEDSNTTVDVNTTCVVDLAPPCVGYEHFNDGDIAGPSPPPPFGTNGLPDGKVAVDDLNKVVQNWGCGDTRAWGEEGCP